MAFKTDDILAISITHMKLWGKGFWPSYLSDILPDFASEMSNYSSVFAELFITGRRTKKTKKNRKDEPTAIYGWTLLVQKYSMHF